MKASAVIAAASLVPNQIAALAEDALSCVACSDRERAAARVFLDAAISEAVARVTARASQLALAAEAAPTPGGGRP